MHRLAPVALLAALFTPAVSHAQTEDEALRQSVEQLRLSVGRWEVATSFLNEDGSVSKTVAGTYEFTWVVPDRVLSGRSDIPEMSQSSGILFYIRESKRQIEMVSVGPDGRLWIMTGPLGEEVRLSQEYKTQDGTGQLRFTRFNVFPNAFESRMEYTEDGGTTWKPGNHQVFRRAQP